MTQLEFQFIETRTLDGQPLLLNIAHIRAYCPSDEPGRTLVTLSELRRHIAEPFDAFHNRMLAATEIFPLPSEHPQETP